MDRRLGEGRLLLSFKAPRARFVFGGIFEVDGRWLVENETFPGGRKEGGQQETLTKVLLQRTPNANRGQAPSCMAQISSHTQTRVPSLRLLSPLSRVQNPNQDQWPLGDAYNILPPNIVQL